jgi:hypothetical protein
MRFLSLAVLLGLLTAPAAAQTGWRNEPPAHVTRTGYFASPAITEASGAVASRSQTGVIWVVNDSGNDAVVYAVDSSGRDLGTFRLPGAVNRDWEAISLGPCPAGSCLLIGDLGDNLERRPSVTLFRFPEPAVVPGSPAGTVRAAVDSLRVRYPDGAHDVEGLYVDARGDAYLVSKGRSQGIRLFRVGADAWSGSETVAEFIESVPIAPDAAIGQWVTDAALAPDGARVAIRTYSAVFFFRVGDDGSLTPDEARACVVPGLEPQGEGVTWLDDRRLLLVSEAARTSAGPLHVLECSPRR